jgi:hypothetical protein
MGHELERALWATRRSFLGGCVALVAGGLLAGCGGAHESSVSGMDYLDDKPLNTGNVTFYPSEGGAAVYSRIGADGAYELKTGDTFGLKPGEYKVTVVATEMPTVVPGSTPPIGKVITPSKYGQLEETDLVFTVEAGSNTIDLRLKSK